MLKTIRKNFIIF